MVRVGVEVAGGGFRVHVRVAATCFPRYARRLDELGFGAADLDRLRRLARGDIGLSNGMCKGTILFVGPADSGIEDTLRSFALEAFDLLDQVVLAVERFVEAELPGVVHFEASDGPLVDLLQGIYRHDPDVLLLTRLEGDEVRLALQGYPLVLASLVAEDAASALESIASRTDPDQIHALEAILVQRRIRTTCRSCLGKGCDACEGSGHGGRMPIVSLVRFDRYFVDGKGAIDDPRLLLRDHTLVSLRQSALDAVREGLTTLEEALALPD